MAETGDLLTAARQEHLRYYETLSRQLPELEGEVIVAAEGRLRAPAAAGADDAVAVSAPPFSPPVIEAVAAAVEYCEFTGHADGVRYYRYWHALLLADQALCD